ncbi:PLC-like phosphodiesterase [Stipitochalara longipes BDJ]|nr:PLC-like phosphodiesterase [Stipitochalara longipes BDJ]
MRFGKTLWLGLCPLLISLPYVAAGPGGYVTLINGSPYDWKLTYSHSYQMDWKPVAVIPAGASHQQYLEYWYQWGEKGDCAAEATYELVGSPEKAMFQLQARQSNGKNIRIQYLDSLDSLNNQRHSLIDLGFEHDGSVLFVLAGNGQEPYISSNPPPDWMQATLSTIGSKTLREITILASHNAGMSKANPRLLYGGVPHNTETQSLNMDEQLMSGVRWFDIRPFHDHDRIIEDRSEWHTGHFSKFANSAVGGAGQSIKDIINSVNSFTELQPGELIILDLSHELAKNDHWSWRLTPDQWQYLYEIMGRIEDLWITNSTIPKDYSSVPLSTFIQPGSKSAVLIRIPDYAPLPQEGEAKYYNPLPISAFVRQSDFYFTGSYSNTENANTLSSDQLKKLRDLRQTTQSLMHRSTWTITPSVWKLLDVATWKNSIIGQAVHAHRKLFSSLWPALSKSTYPNLIEVDNINSQITALCMAINDRFARR